MLVFLNGQFLQETQAVVPVNDRGFLLGDGLFETMRVVGGKPFRFAQHLERMTRGADFLKIKLPFTPKKLEKFAAQLIEKNKMPDAILRVTLTRGSGGRGYLPNNEAKPTLVMTLHAAPDAGVSIGWNLATSSFRIPAADPLASFKTTSKILNVMARAEANEKGADEALLLNTNDFVAETTSANLFWIERNEICTPPLTSGILPGVTRATIFEIASSLKIPVGEKNIRLKNLPRANGIFLSLTSLGIVEAKSLDGKILSKSPLTAQIARAYDKMLKSSS